MNQKVYGKSADAKVNVGERGINIQFTDSSISSSPIWTMAEWQIRFIQLAANTVLEIDQSVGIKNYVKVITGELSNIKRKAFAPVREVRSTLIEGEYIQAGDKGAIVAVMIKTKEALEQVREISEVKVTGHMEALLNWVACENYNWGREAFNGMPFYNLPGFQIKNSRGKEIVYMQFWAAGKGVNCGMHAHEDAKPTFCEVHLGMFNGTGKGGMVDENEKYIPLLEGEEHGPFWRIDAETGEPILRENGAVYYNPHRWQAGGEMVKYKVEQAFDVWLVFEIAPEEARIDLSVREDDNSNKDGRNNTEIKKYNMT